MPAAQESDAASSVAIITSGQAPSAAESIVGAAVGEEVSPSVEGAMVGAAVGAVGAAVGVGVGAVVTQLVASESAAQPEVAESQYHQSPAASLRSEGIVSNEYLA